MPHDFGGFVLRVRKYARGTAELVQLEVWPFLKSPAYLLQKWDAVMQLAWYVISPLAAANAILSAYVLHILWADEQLPLLNPLLPYLFIWMLLAMLCLYVSVSSSWPCVMKFYFWSTAIHAAAIPLAGVSFVHQLVAKSRARFDVTPKNGEASPVGVGNSISMVALGVIAIASAVSWPSPFSFVVAGQGVAYLSYPAYGKLCDDSFAGRVARGLVVIPGSLMLIGLYAMWQAVGGPPLRV